MEKGKENRQWRKMIKERKTERERERDRETDRHKR